MISPQCTPFTGNEARFALGISPRVYDEALRSGTLQRSVHFDSRVSDVTALHSLVDVVRFDLLFHNPRRFIDPTEFEKECDLRLDDICSLYEFDCEVVRLSALGRTYDLMRCVDPILAEHVHEDRTIVWNGELTVLFDVVGSWCRCYRALVMMLNADKTLTRPYLRRRVPLHKSQNGFIP